MLKITKLAVVLFALLSFTANSQIKSFSDGPFGLGGGFVASWLMPDVAPVNDAVTGFGDITLPESGLLTYGGGGFVYIGVVKNLRVGGMGLGGLMSETSTVTGTEMELIYSYGMGGATIEYTLPFVRKWAAISAGLFIGAGSITIEAYSRQSAYDWSALWNELKNNTNTNNISREFSNTFLILAPTLNFDIPLHRLVMFRIGAGYNMTVGGDDWYADNGQKVVNAPDDIKGGAFFVQTGLMVGFFAF